MDRRAWEHLDPWLEIRRRLPIGAMLCVILLTDRPLDAGGRRRLEPPQRRARATDGHDMVRLPSAELSSSCGSRADDEARPEIGRGDLGGPATQ
jgi:hypothetical protein